MALDDALDVVLAASPVARGGGVHSVGPNLPASLRKGWIRLGVQTAVAAALLRLWLRTVSLPELRSLAHVRNWWRVVRLAALATTPSTLPAGRWLTLLRPLPP